MEGGIAQNNHALFKLPNEPLKGVIRDIGGGTLPRHHQSPLVQHQTQFAPDNPAVIRQSLAADLVGTPALADGVDQLHAIRVDDAEHRRSSQEGCRPRLRGAEEAKEPCPLGYTREQHAIVPRQPAIERAVPPTFEGMQEPQGYDFTRPQGGVGMFRDACEMVIHLAE